MKCFWKKTVLPLLAFSLLALNAETPRYLRVTGDQQAAREILTNAATSKSGTITLVSPEPGATVPTLNPTQKAYLKMSREERIKFFVSEEQRKKLREGGFYPQPVKLQWNCGNAGHAHQVIISESPKFTDAVAFTVNSSELSLDNFKIAQKYYWRVAGPDGEASPVGEFTTEAIAPRLLRIETLWNVRDLGGRIGRDGRRVKQGLIYRSGGLNNNSSADKDKPENAFRNRPDLMKKYQSYMKIIDDCQKQIKENKTVAYLPKKLIGRDWLVCQPDGSLTDEQVRELAASVKSQPVRIAGAEAYRVSANENYTIAFPPIDGGCMFFVQEFDSDADGMIQLEIGGYRIYATLNGKPIFDILATGPGRRIKKHILEVAVRKGKNRLVAAVRSNAMWRDLYCRQLEPPAERTRVLESAIILAELAANAMLPYAPRQTMGKVLLTEETKRYVVCDLGWKNDVDLRGEAECYGMTGSPAGPPVKWRRYTFLGYSSLFHQMGKNVFRDVFKIFLDPNNYPIDFHCIGGQDRTGTLAFILNALLGVSEEELFLDWEVTAFWNRKVVFNHSRFLPLIAVISRYPGNTIQEKVENYVLECGITRDDINWFREFMLEK